MDDQTQHRINSKSRSNSITLWPYRSLSKRGYRLLMLALAALMFGIGTMFFVMGAWPVIGFLGLEIAVVWYLFRMNYRSARQHENLTASNSVFRIERVGADGDRKVDEMPAGWLRARLDKPDNEEATRAGRLIVSSHGREEEIGAFLHDAEKKELLPEINTMIQQAKDQSGDTPADESNASEER